MNFNILLLFIMFKLYYFDQDSIFNDKLKKYNILLSQFYNDYNRKNAKIIYFFLNSNCYKNYNLNVSLITFQNDENIFLSFLKYNIINLKLYSHIEYFNFQEKQNENIKYHFYNKNIYTNPILIYTREKVIIIIFFIYLEYKNYNTQWL